MHSQLIDISPVKILALNVRQNMVKLPRIVMTHVAAFVTPWSLCAVIFGAQAKRQLQSSTLVVTNACN